MFKITSRFYVIYGDGIPIYVGYTNRTVKQRFKEHKISKDFSDFDEVRVEELKKDELDFNFSWDYSIIESEANEVSKKEAKLVEKFGTQDSEFQKADGGGEVWNNIKHFVLSNQNNPNFTGMSTSDIKRTLDKDKLVSTWLHSFVSSQRPGKEVWLSNFIGNQRPNKEIWLSHFVSNQRPVKEVWLSSFVSGQRPGNEIWLSSFVSSQRPGKEIWLSDFVNDQMPGKEVWLHSFVSNQRPGKEVWLSNFVSRQRPGKEVWLSNFVGSQRPGKEVWLSSFVGNQKVK